MATEETKTAAKPAAKPAVEVTNKQEPVKPAEPVANVEAAKVEELVKTEPAASDPVKPAEPDSGTAAIAAADVIASVNQRYTLNLGTRTVVHEPGIHKMPREEAEHPFAKIRGTIIVGIPEVGTLNDYHAQEQLKDTRVKAENLVLAINGLVSHVSELTEEQKKAVESALGSAKNALEALSGLE